MKTSKLLLLPYRLFLLLFALVLAYPAYAHGQEAIIPAFVMIGLFFGAVGGIFNGLFRKDYFPGLLVTIVVFIVAGYTFALYEYLSNNADTGSGSLASLALPMLQLQAMISSVPLLLGYFICNPFVRHIRNKLKFDDQN